MTTRLRMVIVFGAVLLALLADLWFVRRPEPHAVSEFNPFEARLGNEELILGGAVTDSGPLLDHQGRNELIEVVADKGDLSEETAHMLASQHPPGGGGGNSIRYMGTGDLPKSDGVPQCTSSVRISLENPDAGELHIFQSGVANGSSHREIDLMATGTRLVAAFDVIMDDPSQLPPEGCKRVLTIGDGWSRSLTGRPLTIVAAAKSAIRISFKPASSSSPWGAVKAGFAPFDTTHVRARTVRISPLGSGELTRLVRSADTRAPIGVTDLWIEPVAVKAVLDGVGWVTVNGRAVGPMFSEWVQASYLRSAAVALTNLALLLCGLWWIYSGRVREIGKVRGWRGPRQGLRVFLCHCSEDKPTVRKLHERLLADTFAPWLDEEDIRGGRAWEREIEQALNESDAVVICLSREFVVKTGYVQRELREAIRLASYRPPGDIYVIPVRLEQCPIPADLLQLQCIDVYRDGGYERLVEVLRERALQVHPEPGATAAAG